MGYFSFSDLIQMRLYCTELQGTITNNISLRDKLFDFEELDDVTNFGHFFSPGEPLFNKNISTNCLAYINVFHV